MIRKLILLSGFVTGQFFWTFGQSRSANSDYLSKEFHKGRREALRTLMPAQSVAVIFAAPERNYANDVDYVYHQNPDLYYFTGYTEPNAVLLIFKEKQTGNTGTYDELFFVQRRDSLREQWTGKRLGVAGAKSKLGFSDVFNNSDFASVAPDLKSFKEILFDEIPVDVRDELSDSADLNDLIRQFRSKAGLREDYNTTVLSIYATITKYDSLYRDKLIPYVRNLISGSESAGKDPLLNAYLTAGDSAKMNKVVEEMTAMGNPPSLYNELVGSLREIKTPEEMKLLRKAIDISCAGQAEVMRAIQPGMSERQLQGIHEFVHKTYGAESVGYPSIIGAGANGCILHYIDNNEPQAGNRMVLMDVGAEYHGYTADVTRTVPAKGKFSPEELALYNIVYEAQEAVFKVAKEGTPFHVLNDTTKAVVARGLLKLGLIKDEKEVGKYYPHGVSHHLGLDVHDKSNYGVLKKGMVITVEPGIYVPENSACDKKWWGIAIRIEDDVLVQEHQCELLSGSAPRKASDVEKMISQKSSLDEYFRPAM